MTWREDLRRVSFGGRRLVGASFRGVAFFVESAESSGGRRAVVHEFPLRDDPFVEDLGRRARTFRVDGYVIGDDYMLQRNALLVALEDNAGPGELVHPHLGTLRAICTNVSYRETRAEGGMATFAIEFAETPTQAPVPVEVVDSVEQVAKDSDAAIVATKAEFAEKYNVDKMPSFALTSATTALTKAADGLKAALAPIVTATQELAQLNGNVSLLTATAASLVRTPASILDQFRAAITGLVDTAKAAPGAVMDGLFEAYITNLGPAIVATTATRTRELANQNALFGALRRVIAVEAARLAPLVKYKSIDEAMAARDQVAKLLEEQAGGAGDTAYPALVNLRSEALRAVPGGSQFARIVAVTRNVPIPSLLLAYQLYGSVTLELDVIARNSVRHPGFVAGELKVLSDAGV